MPSILYSMARPLRITYEGAVYQGELRGPVRSMWQRQIRRICRWLCCFLELCQPQPVRLRSGQAPFDFAQGRLRSTSLRGALHLRLPPGLEPSRFFRYPGRPHSCPALRNRVFSTTTRYPSLAGIVKKTQPPDSGRDFAKWRLGRGRLCRLRYYLGGNG